MGDEVIAWTGYSVRIMSDRKGLLRAEASYYMEYLEKTCFSRTSVYVI